MFKRVEHLYEVSIWTLQDSFITVLKWSGIENKGQIQKPKLIFDSDGTSNFNFSIPMYLASNEENPIWYNTTNGNLMIGMRKIKVILNKGKLTEKVYEFIITKVNERHENNQLFCDIECEGLAFHELGKIGYKLSLSPEEFYINYENWFTSGEGSEPKATIDYWLKLIGISSRDEAEVILPNKWYYKINMDWGAFNYDIGFNPKKIYEEEYVSSWQFENGSLTAREIVQPEEKKRMVSIEESNFYNITQKIAETFRVFCRYEYDYDEQYHIIARTIVFYNNFLEEDSGYMDLTYPYHTSEISREMDSSELTTKLFVRPVDYEYSSTGQITIMSVDANKSREDYLLNFDYLHDFQIISDEQYEEINNYEITLHNINVELENLATQIIVLEQQKLNLESKIQIERNSKDAAIRQYTLANDHITALTNNNQTGTITIDKTNAKALIVLQNKDTGTYYVKIPFVGVVPETVRLYNGTLDYTKEDPFEDTELVTNGEFVFDEYGQLIQINRLSASYSSLWLTCEYVPETYWTTISNYWGTEVNKINAQLLIDEAKVGPLTTSLNTAYGRQEILLAQKATVIKDFEEMMGPALREGYWQPDDYKDYGNKQTAVFNSFTTIGKATYIYDTNEYEEDTKLTYYEGSTPKKYLTIDLSFLNNEQLRYISNNYNQLSFIYYDKNIIDLNNSLEDATLSQKMTYIKNTVKSIPIDSGCRFGFIKIGNTTTIKPALIIEESKIMTAEQITFFLSHSGNYTSKIGIFNYDAATYTPIIDANAINILSSYYLTNSTISEVHPRVIIDSLSLKVSEDELLLCLNNTLLKEFKDYSVFIKVDARDNIEKYFINIKPQVYFQLGNLMPTCKINYTISNADLLIYLDALQISKENAFPKVAYTVKLSVYDPAIIHDIYNKMCKVVHINDVQLKFDNVYGYISHIEIDLDHPWEDSIEVKNYKTKFEDLFSNIVAQTEAMSKNSFNYDVAAAAFNSDGTMSNNTTEKMLLSNTSVFNTYLDSYFDTSQVVRDRLSDIFTEAGAVLNDANSALFNIAALTTKNADILAGFARGANEGFTKDIELISSDHSKTSAIRISKDKGIFIGANLGVSIFSGGAGIGGSSVDLNADHLLLGVSDDEEGTAAEFTKSHIILAAGDVVNDEDTDLETLSITGVSGTLVGAKLTKDSIGFATQNDDIINAVLMNDKGVTIGSGVNVNATTEALRQLEGSYVRIAPTGIDLGSTADLYINTNNFKLQTNNIIDENTEQIIGKDTIFAIGSDLQSIDENTTVVNGEFRDSSNQRIEDENNIAPDVILLVNKNGAYIKGTVHASDGYFSGTLFADQIVVRNYLQSESSNISFDNYIASKVTANLIEDQLTATDYWKLLNGDFTGWDTTHSSAVEFWSNIQTTINNISGITSTTLSTIETNVTNIMNGNTGLAFTGDSAGDNIYNVQLNKGNGLLIEGYIDPSDTTKGTMYLKATHGAMGFFKKVNDVESAMVYIDGPSGDLGLKGAIYAESGWIGGANGWLIGAGAIEAADGTVLLHTSTSSSSGATFELRKKNNDNTYTRKLLFNGSNLYVEGIIMATSGTFTGTIQAQGGWLGTSTNGWLIGTETVSATEIGKIQSANGRLILSAGTSNSSQNPYILLKNNSNQTVFRAQDGNVEITGTIKASGGWFGAEDGWVIGGNLTTPKSITTIMNSSTGIPQSTSSQSGSRIQSANNKVIINAGSSSTEPYIIMRKSNGSQLEDVFEYYNGQLAIKGAIQATSFQLIGGATGGYTQLRSWLINTTSTVYTATNPAPTSGWTDYTTSSPPISSNQGKYLHTRTITSIGGQFTTTYDITYISKDGTNGSDGDPGFNIDGLSNGQRQYFSSSSTLINTVEVSSTNALVLGANYGVYVARSSNSALSNSYASISSTGINFDYSSSNYVHINNNGIDIGGNRISINGDQVWARDDIIVLKSGDNEQSVINSMSGKHDWVLIKPYYNAECMYISNQVFTTNNNALNNGVLAQQGTGQLSLGNDSSEFKYILSFDVKTVDYGTEGIPFVFELSNSPSFPTGNTVTCTSGTIQVLNSSTYASFTCPTVTLSGANKINLCQEGSQIYVKVTETSGANFYVTNIKLICQADATTSKVPCTVYYYP